MSISRRGFLGAMAAGAGTLMARPARNPHRTQNRITENFEKKTGTYHDAEFKNEPNTDWSLAANRRWAEDICSKWKKV